MPLGAGTLPSCSSVIAGQPQVSALKSQLPMTVLFQAAGMYSEPTTTTVLPQTVGGAALGQKSAGSHRIIY